MRPGASKSAHRPGAALRFQKINTAHVDWPQSRGGKDINMSREHEKEEEEEEEAAS